MIKLGVFFTFILLNSSVVIAKDYKKQIKCLADNIYNEARGEPISGQKAIALVTLNRTKKTKKNVCEIVYQKGQFSWTKRRNLTTIDQSVYNDILQLAKYVYNNFPMVNDITNGATHFHSSKIKNPWNFKKTVRIGDHIFYKT